MAAKPKVEFLVSARDMTRGVFRRIRRSISGITTQLTRFRTLVIGVFGAALGASLGRTIERLGNLNDAAAGLRVPTDYLQAFRRGAEEVGEQASSADTVLQRLQTNAGRAATGDFRLAEAFEKFGLSVADLESMGTEQIMDRLISRAREMTAIQAQAALQPIVDTEGIRLVTRLAGEFGSIAALQQRMIERGQIVDQQTLDRAEALSDVFTDISATIRAAFVRAMVPALESALRLTLRLLNRWDQSALGRAGAFIGEQRRRAGQFGEAIVQSPLVQNPDPFVGQRPGTDVSRMDEFLAELKGQRELLRVQNEGALDYARRTAEALERERGAAVLGD